MVKFIRYGLYLSALAPLIVFEGFLNPFHFGKAIFFRSLIEILGGAYLILILKNRSYLPKRDMLFWTFLVFTGVFALTSLISSIRYFSFWGTLERMGGFWNFWHYFLYFILLRSVFTKWEHWKKFFDIAIFAGLLSAVYGFGQRTDIEFFLGSGGRERIFGTLGNAALFAGYELFIVFLALTMYFKLGNAKIRKIFYLLSFGSATVAVFMTAVRGSILGYIIGILVFSFLFLKQKSTRIAKISLLALIYLIIVFIFSTPLLKDLSFVKSSPYLRRITDISFSSVTAQTRVWVWGSGLNGWAESPKTILLGWGPENFNIPFTKYFNPNLFAGLASETFFDRAHNMFIEVLVTMGIIGLAAYVWLVGTPFVYLRRLLQDREFNIYGIGLSAVLTAYVVHNLFIFDTLPNFLLFFSLLGFISWATKTNSKSESEDRLKSGISKRIEVFATLGVILSVSFLIYKTSILPARANYIAARAVSLTQKGDFTNGFNKFKEALAYNTPGIYEYRHKLVEYLIGPGGPSLKDKGVKEANQLALIESDKNIDLTKKLNHIPHLYAGRLNINLGQNDKALAYLNQAIKISPSFVRSYYEIAQVYTNKRDFLRAIDNYKKAVDLNPETGISHWYLGIAKLRVGDQSGINDLSQALIVSNRYTPTLQEIFWLADLYEKTKNYSALIEIYKYLVGFYAGEGKLDKAESFGRKIVELNPATITEVKTFFRRFDRELQF